MHGRDRQRQFSQQFVEPLALYETLRQPELATVQAERQAHQEIAVLFLAAKRQVVTRRPIAEQFFPVHGSQRRIDLFGREAARVKPADDSAHARAGDRIDRHAHLFEHLEHAHMGRAARASAGEHEPHSRPRVCSRSSDRHGNEQQGEQPQEIHPQRIPAP